MTRASGRLINQAIAWWEKKRPEGWTERQHLADPTVNCESTLDMALAKSVRNVLSCRQSKQCKVCGAADASHVSSKGK